MADAQSSTGRPPVHPRQARIGYVLSHEQFPPRQIVANAIAAERAGFDEVWASDHFHPWMDNQVHAGHAWVTMGAYGQHTTIRMGTGVTCPSFRYRPAEVAQAFATLGSLYPGRVFLGIGGGEAVNEVAAGGGWGSYRERAARMAEAVRLIRRLWTGEWVQSDGPYYPIPNAKIYDLPEQPVPIYLAASGPNSARLAGELGDGWITVMDSALDPKLHAAFADGARAAGKDPSALPILVEHYVVVGGRAEAEEAARLWRFNPIGFSLASEPDPRKILQAAEEQVTLEQAYSRWPVSDDPEVHVQAIRRFLDAGVTDVFIHSGQMDQQRVIDFYGREVLPRLRAVA